MKEKSPVSRTMTVIMGVMFLAMGAIAFVCNLNMVGATMLVIIGIIGIVGGIKGSFEEKDQG